VSLLSGFSCCTSAFPPLTAQHPVPAPRRAGNCLQGDLSIAQPLYLNLTGSDPNLNPTAQVSWEFTDCGPLIEGGVKASKHKAWAPAPLSTRC
jgi:hypothetical protein